jgi:hypothetical protein
MNRNLKPTKLIYVAILLAAYSSIYINDFLCSYDHGLVQITQQHDNRGGHNPHNQTSATDQTHNRSHSHDNNSNDDNCCKDLTDSFLFDLSRLISPTFELKIKTFNAPFSIYNINTQGLKNKNTQFIVQQYKLTPPKIPDIRVLIQSFII